MAATLDDVLSELKALVSAQNIANTMQQAQQAILSGRTGVAGGGGFWNNTMAGRLASQSSLVQSGRSAAANAGRIMGGGGTSGLEGLSALGKVAGGAVGVVSALNGFRKAVESATQTQLDSYRRLAEVSGGMAAVMVQRDFQQMMRDMRMGDAQAGSAGRLAESENRRKNASEPLENALADLKNGLLAGMNDLLADFYDWGVDRLNDLFKAIPDWIDGGYQIAKSTPAAGGPLSGALDAIAKQAEKIEKDARDAMNNARAKPRPGAAKPGRLP